ncbi:MAG: cytochrome c oxidase subunit II [Planctomycetales bacterium]|nr:cytochrome c oxidase subunit II [Planctomycetales bacterium]
MDTVLEVRLIATVIWQRCVRLLPGLLVAVLTAPAWAGPDLSEPTLVPPMFDPAGPGAENIRTMFWIVIGITAVIFLLVTTSLVWFIFRYREREDDDQTEPPQIYGSRALEFAWTLAPLLTVTVLAILVIRSVVQLHAKPAAQVSEQVRVVGHQWWWEFNYPDYGITTANELVIPVSDLEQARPVDLQLESADVIHSFWVPRLAGKTDLVPGRTNHMWMQANHEGTYFGRCAEYCGTQHAKMLLRIESVSQAAFAQWVEHQQADANHDPAVEIGRRQFMEMACMNCHTIRGTRASGRLGPDLTHLMSRKTLCAGIVENNRVNLTRWVTNPDNIKRGCRMPNMRLSDADVKSIVDYLTTLE